MNEVQVLEYIREMFIKETKDEELTTTTEVLLSSLQILNMLSKVEKKFGIEIEDELVFHGLFSSIQLLSDYVMKLLEEV